MIELLIIEDSDEDAALAIDSIESSDLDVSIRRATRLSEAMELLAKKKADVVVLDLGLPGGSGLENIKELRAFDESVPIIVMTGWDEAFAVKILQAGAREFLTKDALLNGKLTVAIRRVI